MTKLEGIMWRWRYWDRIVPDHLSHDIVQNHERGYECLFQITIKPVTREHVIICCRDYNYPIAWMLEMDFLSGAIP